MRLKERRREWELMWLQQGSWQYEEEKTVVANKPEELSLLWDGNQIFLYPGTPRREKITKKVGIVRSSHTVEVTEQVVRNKGSTKQNPFSGFGRLHREFPPLLTLIKGSGKSP